MILSYKYRIEPNTAQRIALATMLSDFCTLYNAGLQQRIEAYRRCGVSLRYTQQALELRSIRSELPEYTRWSFSAEQQVLRRLDRTFIAFFNRNHGYPRFRSKDRYHAAEFRVGDGLTIRHNGHIGLTGVPGEIRVRWHRTLPSKPASGILTRQNGKWYIVFHVKIEPQNRQYSAESIGIDFGLTNLVALSNGTIIKRPKWTKSAARGLRQRNRALARCKRGSINRAKRKASIRKYHAHIANKRRDHLHKLSHSIARSFGTIAVEDLNIEAMARQSFAKHIYDASWAQLTLMLTYKAVNAGGELIKVNSRGSSQECPQCERYCPKTLNDRTHNCICGCNLDRDVAAAIVIHQRALNIRPGTGRETLSGPQTA